MKNTKVQTLNSKAEATLFAATIKIAALDEECAVRTLRRLADLIEAAPEGPGWTVSNIEGNAVAERRAAP